MATPQRQNSPMPNTPGADGAPQLPPNDRNRDGKIRKAFYGCFLLLMTGLSCCCFFFRDTKVLLS
jgi:hypothetical protein